MNRWQIAIGVFLSMCSAACGETVDPERALVNTQELVTAPPAQVYAELDAVLTKIQAVPLTCTNSFCVVILQFLDQYNSDLATGKRSCVHLVTPGGEIMPFDTYNTFYRPGTEGAAVVKRARGHL